jgi:hypothetical protein
MAYQTIEEALENAGSDTLAHLGSNATKLTVEEVQAYEEDNALVGAPKEGEYRAYAGPYSDVEDPRNAWTANQDLGLTSRTAEQLPPEEEVPVEGGETPLLQQKRKKEEEEKRRRQEEEENRRKQEQRRE